MAGARVPNQVKRWLALLALAALGCGSSDDDGSGGGSAPCTAGMLTLVGELDGQPVAVELDWSSRSWNQLGTPKTLDVGYAGGTVHLEWSELIARGDGTAASGTIVMPADAPRAGETICAGAGTTILDADDAYRFALRGLSLGPTCPGAGVAGSIDGCVADDPP